MPRRYVLVGNGPASVSAAIAIRQRDSTGDILIVGDEKPGFYSRPGLAYLLTGTVPEGHLFSRPDSEYRRYGLRRQVGRVTRLDPKGHRVELASGQTIDYDRLLLAPGARALRPNVPGMDLDGVVTLDNLDDARRILKLARRAKTAVVVGGGITALELAEGLAAQGVATHYLLRKDRYWSNVLDAAESSLVESRLEAEGIRLHRQADLAAVVGKGGRVRAVELKDGRRLDAGIVAVAIGIQPRIELAQAAGLTCDRGVWTDEYMRTSDPDVYAAGDVAEVYDPASGRRVLDSLWSIAIDQGRTAGANMAGAGEPYPRGIPFNVTRIGGLTTTLIGAVGNGREDGDLVALARGDSESWRQQADAFTVEAEADVSRVRLLVGERTLLGAVVMGDQKLSRPLQDLICEQVDILPLRQRLLSSPKDLPDLVTSAWRDTRARR
ncbi:MAG TPA: FAD-dependent oxidoreductase [Anaerolineales bacterium]|nr:FAD-dependent oxidoreductase [Anaerolineales bacterium]